MPSSFNKLISEVKGYPSRLEKIREILLANTVMLGQTPAPTFREERRVRFLLDRFVESGLSDVSTDQIGNAIGVLRGTGDGKKKTLVLAHLDTVFDESVDHTMTVREDAVAGPGVGDNSLGGAILATIPMVLETLELRLQTDLVLMGTVRSLGRGDLEGIRFFLSNKPYPIDFGICLEGIQLGRLSHFSVGMLRGDIICDVEEGGTPAWSEFGTRNAVLILNDVIRELLRVRIPRRPRTSVTFGWVEGGTGYAVPATHAELGMEVRSDSDRMINSLQEQIQDAVYEVAARTEAAISVDFFTRRHASGLKVSHPLVKRTLAVMESLSISPKPSASTSEVSVFLGQDIPAVTLGISTGSYRQKEEETVEIEPIGRGVSQVIGTLLAIDKGFCHAD